MKRSRKSQFDEWSRLSGPARVLIDDVNKRWSQLVQRPAIREQVVHRYLETHAHLFFRDDFNFCTVVSKLRFGAEHVCDFMVVYDQWSNGIEYLLIEIERPDTPPFTKEGIASARLSRAIQQVLSWKTWLTEHPAEARKLFPSALPRMEGRAAFSYAIVIGTRENSKEWLERRNALAESLGIAIRSFDSLSSRLKNRIRFDDFSSVGDEKHFFDLHKRNRLACPFLKALSDTSWRQLLGKARANDHFMHQYGEELLRLREENELARRFRRLHAKQ
jgi:hypothetical protein